MLDDNQIYIVVDIETNGPVAGLYSMLSLAAVATTRDKEISTFYQKLVPLANASRSQSTMDWWKTQPKRGKKLLLMLNLPIRSCSILLNGLMH